MLDNHNDPTGATWDALRRSIEQVQATPRPEAKHLKAANSTILAATACLPEASDRNVAMFAGIPIYVDDDLPHGRWEVRRGSVPDG